MITKISPKSNNFIQFKLQYNKNVILWNTWNSRKLKGEVKIQRDETTNLRNALLECKACKIKKPECGDDPPPCFPRVECRDTYDGPVCGPCPQGFKGDGRVICILNFVLYKITG